MDTDVFIKKKKKKEKKRPESPRVTLTWQSSKYSINKLQHRYIFNQRSQVFVAVFVRVTSFDR